MKTSFALKDIILPCLLILSLLSLDCVFIYYFLIRELALGGFSPVYTMCMTILYVFMSVMFSLSMIMTIFVDAGSPRDAYEKKMREENKRIGGTVLDLPSLLPIMDPYCRKCDFYKPKRTYHCSYCNLCRLKMDHHCLWLNNCIGFHNYKYFYLFLFYGSLIFFYKFAWVSIHSLVIYSRAYPVYFGYCNLHFLYGIIIANFVTFSVFLVIFLYHTHLVLKNLSTIEDIKKDGFTNKLFCRTPDRKLLYDVEVYDLGWKRNLVEVLGTFSWMWAIPINIERETGLVFRENQTTATVQNNNHTFI